MQERRLQLHEEYKRRKAKMRAIFDKHRHIAHVLTHTHWCRASCRPAPAWLRAFVTRCTLCALSQGSRVVPALRAVPPQVRVAL
jgi:hypothetical protein